MQRNHKHSHFFRNSVISFFIFAFAATSTAFAFQLYAKAEAAQKSPASAGLAQKTPGASQFSFTGASDWRQGPSDKVSMAAFHNGNDSCFVSMEYKTDPITIATALQKNQEGFTTTGYTVTPGVVLPMKLRVAAGEATYELHQYAISGGGQSLLGGQGLGYAALKDGYVKVETHCQTANQLTATIPALQAFRFDLAK
jgi:hypothetical protein